MKQLSLEQIRLRIHDVVGFPTKSGSLLTGIVIDDSDPAKVRVQLDNGKEVSVGRAVVEVKKKGGEE